MSYRPDGMSYRPDGMSFFLNRPSVYQKNIMIATDNTSSTSVVLSGVSVNIPGTQEDIDYVYLIDVSHLFNLVDLNAGANPGWTVHKETSFNNARDLIVLVHSTDVNVKIDGTREAVKATKYSYEMSNGRLRINVHVNDQCYYVTIKTHGIFVDEEKGKSIPTISYNV